MADNITLFQETHPSLESYWRSAILFGRNVASYKFALAKSLFEIAPTLNSIGQRNTSFSLAAGVINPKVFRGLVLRDKAISSSSSCV